VPVLLELSLAPKKTDNDSIKGENHEIRPDRHHLGCGPQRLNVPIQNVPKYELVPRGMTALLDAVGRAINETGERLAKMAESDRPSLVIFVVMTDGHENSSKEFNKSQIKEMVERQQNDYDWHFTFLGANQDAFAEAGDMGFDAAGVADYATDKVAPAYMATGGKVSRMRAQQRSGETVSNEFTDEERDQMK